jgi:uncharacterized damage-inducible protein DinB
MFEALIPLNAFNRDYMKRLLHGIEDSELDSTFGEGSHSARWVLVHIAISVDYGFKQLDLPMVASKLWHKAYGPGSDASSNKDVRPPKEELLKFIDVHYAKLGEAALTADKLKMATDHLVPLLEQTPIKTRADLLAHVLTTHFASHLGQLSSWRRLMGLPPLF